MPEPQIQVSVRVTQREQLEEALRRAAEINKPRLLRIPMMLYDYDGNRGYYSLREASWTLTLPNSVEPETVQGVIQAMDRFIQELGQRGVEGLMAVLEGPKGDV